jgi:ABC-type multidrug transport system ATPase subunit
VIARLVAVLGLLVLGAVALARLPLDYLPRRSFPELTVGVALAEPRDPGEVARAWVEPVESAVRSLGQVRTMGGEVRADGAELTVRFAPGTDPERKAARLESELVHLRRLLPAGSALWVEPAAEREGALLAIVWLSNARDDAGARAAAEELRGVPGVREADLFGAWSEETRILLPAREVDPWGLAEVVTAEAARSLRVPSLGTADQGGRRWPLLVQTRERSLAALPIPSGEGAVPLGTLATIEERRRPPKAQIRLQGRPARALFVRRAHGVPLLATDRALRRALTRLPGGVQGTVGWSEAEPLRALVHRLALAGLLATALSALLGAFLAGRGGAAAMGLAVPAALAAAAIAFQLAGVPLDVTTLVALTLGVLGIVPLAAMQLAHRGGSRPWALTAVAAAAVVPAAVALASAELGPLLAEPARALLLTVSAGVGATLLLPRTRPQERALASASRASAITSAIALRDPGTAVLVALTAGYIAVTAFGGALIPAPGDLRPDRGNLTLVLRLPAGSTLAETTARARQAEAKLGKAEEVERFWSYSVPGEARIVAEIRRQDRRPDRMARLATRLRYELSSLASVELTAGTQAGRGVFLAALEDRAATDEEAMSYRVVLCSADLGTLRVGYDRLLQRLETLKVKRSFISGWGTPAIHLVLYPRPGTSPSDAEALAAGLFRASTAPSSLPLPGEEERSLSVASAGTPEEPDRAIPQAADLLERPLQLGGRAAVPTTLFAVAEEVTYDRVARQAGRFVLPVDVTLPYSAKAMREKARASIDASLNRLPLPPGCDLERPRLAPSVWERERMRVLLLALAVPLLLFAVAACRLDSPLRALAVLITLGLGLLAAAPLVAASLGQVDELTVLALAASLALTLPTATEVAGASRAAGPAAGARLYRSVRRQVPWILGALPVLTLALTLPTLGADLQEMRWVTPLRAAALSGGVSMALSTVLVPALLLAGARLRERDPEEVRRRRHPPGWEVPGEPILEVRSLTKVYGGGVAALNRVDFTLTPGIVGLLGPNGAGKTTLLRILTGLLEPSRGAVLYRGVPISAENLAEYRRRIGFLPQEFNAYPDFTAEEFLDHWAVERGLADPRERRREIERLLAEVGLAEHARRKVRDFSGGMRQRVGIARALLGAPPILIVDEPTTGLDVEARGRFRQILLEQAAERVVLFSTHIASDVEAAASRILLLHRGRLCFDGPPETLVDRARGRVFRALVDDAELAAFGHRYRVTSRVRVLEGIEARAVARPGEPLAGDPVEPNLEEAYLAEIDREEVG